MPKPTRYRVIPYTIEGRAIEVTGLARPGFKEKQTAASAIAYLNHHQVHTVISLEDRGKNQSSRTLITKYPDMQYIEDYAVTDFQPPSIETLEGIYNIVHDHALNGKKVAIHCAAGLGRTGSVLAALKLKELMLAMPSDALTAHLNRRSEHIQLGQYAKGYSKDDTRECTTLVKKSIEMIRSQGRFYNVDYVENEEQVDQLCEYQEYLIQKILEQRLALNQACQCHDVTEIRLQISQGASPTDAQFVQAYTDGNIDVMNVLIEGGLLPTDKICEPIHQPEHHNANLFLELAILASQLETKLEKLSFLSPNDTSKRMMKDMNTVLTAVRQFSLAWSNENMPSETQFHDLSMVLDNATTSSLADHRDIIRKSPVLREVASATQIIIQALSFLLKKAYKLITLNTESVHAEGLKAILQQPETDTVIKIRALKDKIQTLKQAPDNPPPPNPPSPSKGFND